MATPIKNNLPPASQQWVRDIERRMADLERENRLLGVTANKNATQIGAMQESLRAARIGTQSVDISRTASGSGASFVEALIPVPEWARSVVLIAPLSIYNLGSGGNISASLGVYLLSSGPDREVASIPAIEATNRASSPSPNANNSATTARTVNISPGDTHISLGGTYAWSSVPPHPITGGDPAAFSWGLTVFWSANDFALETN